jgi:hypothetical protein
MGKWLDVFWDQSFCRQVSSYFVFRNLSAMATALFTNLVVCRPHWAKAIVFYRCFTNSLGVLSVTYGVGDETHLSF